MAKGIKYDFVIAKNIKKNQKYRHLFLTKGSDFDQCRKTVIYFFQNYKLVHYFNTNIINNESFCASNPHFWDVLEEAILKNRKILHELAVELKNEGVYTLQDLEHLSEGYKSKMLHVITHFIDGFFGIDSYFYNLIEDSHWVSEELRKKINANPPHYWLIAAEADFDKK